MGFGFRFGMGTGISRRHLLASLSLWPVTRLSAAAAVPSAPGELRMAAAWEADSRYHIGLLSLKPGAAVRELASIEVPTRAHGVWVDSTGRLVAVARRPGDWMLRWAGPGSAPQWRWIEPLRAFNGHALADPERRRLLTTETDLDSGAGLLGVRDARTLAKLDEWPTHGLDPHQLLWDRLAPGHLIVANGGIATTPETGRVKQGLARMDSSIVRIDARSASVSGGSSDRLSGQWRMSDPRLSLRHLAWSEDGLRLGIAVQAQHDDAAQRAAAPVLAVFDGREVRASPAPQSLAGYGGDIVATTDGFIVSCPRVDGVARFDTQGTWQGFVPLPQACALAGVADGITLAGGEPRAARVSARAVGEAFSFDLAALRLDNHWQRAGR